jgi:hypothetical protein
MSSECRDGQVPGVTDQAGSDPAGDLAGCMTGLDQPLAAEAAFRNEDTRWRRNWIDQALDGARGRLSGAGRPAPRRGRPRLRLVRDGRPR